MSRIFFPLRTSVELFADPTSPTAVTRAKEAAILYDELFFETGVYDASITPNGSTNFWTPPDHITDEQLKLTRQPVALGQPMTFAVGKQPRPGQPATQMRVAFQGNLSARYVAEFHSEILNELAQFNPEWVKGVATGGSAKPGRRGEPTFDAIGQLDFSDLGNRELMPDTESFLRSFISQSFNRDSVLSAALSASFNVTPLFAEMVRHRGIEPEHAGGEALGLVVADLGALPWEGVVEFREHPGSGEARERLREFERLAASQEPEDAYDFLKKVSQEINRANRAAIEDLAPSLPEDLAKEILLTTLSVTSVIGPVIEKVASIASAASEIREFGRSWIAALMKLPS